MMKSKLSIVPLVSSDYVSPQEYSSPKPRFQNIHHIFSFFFYIFFMFLNLTYIVCVSKWHKIHKNTILLCNITLFLIHPSIFSLISLAYFNATLAANIVRGLFLTEILPQLGLLKCHNNNYFCCLLPNLAFLTLK